MPQNEYIERHTKRFGKRLDHDEKARKKQAREGHAASARAQNLRGLRAKLYAESRRKEKIQLKKTIRSHEERNIKSSAPAAPTTEANPEVCSFNNTLKQMLTIPSICSIDQTLPTPKL
jgi:ribosome biogenesis protein NSA2